MFWGLVREWWVAVSAAVRPLTVWLAARQPAGIPHWVWALAVVAAAYVGGRLGGRLAASLVRLVLLAAALVIGWQLVHPWP